MEPLHELKGIVDRFLFQNTENGYAVVSLQIDEKTTVVAADMYTISKQVKK